MSVGREILQECLERVCYAGQLVRLSPKWKRDPGERCALSEPTQPSVPKIAPGITAGSRLWSTRHENTVISRTGSSAITRRATHFGLFLSFVHLRPLVNPFGKPPLQQQKPAFTTRPLNHNINHRLKKRQPPVDRSTPIHRFHHIRTLSFHPNTSP